MKTLDPLDPDFRPTYDNNDQSSEYATASGFSYHQGPVRRVRQGWSAIPGPDC